VVEEAPPRVNLCPTTNLRLRNMPCYLGDVIQTAIWARELRPSLFMMLLTWAATVRSEMKRRAPICLLLRPSATSRPTPARGAESLKDGGCALPSFSFQP